MAVPQGLRHKEHSQDSSLAKCASDGAEVGCATRAEAQRAQPGMAVPQEQKRAGGGEWLERDVSGELGGV